MSGSTLVLIAALVFLVTHLGVSSTGLRGALVGMLGERGYAGVYSIVAAASLGFLIYAYLGASHAQFLF
ncbi:MAG: NnrU family protein, partial [Gammaproteobacteria bacterium]